MMKANTRNAVRYASSRAAEVWYVGFLLLLFWLVLIAVGPIIESRYFPVISQFSVFRVEGAREGKIAFQPIFTKTRDCSYRDHSWFVVDEAGRTTRRRVEPRSDSYPPTSRPAGEHVGSWWEMTIEEDDVELYGVLYHACGFPWESKSVVGPLRLRAR